ncbi:MAG: TIGR04283 family arsenosugar biosynthesis glycosyltransferase, partial [Desulfobacterales bacterium]
FAVQSKYVAAVAVPFLINRKNFRYAAASVMVIILPYLFLADTEFTRFFYSLKRFGEEYAFNGSIHGLFRAWSGSIQTATTICSVLLCLILFFGIKQFHPGLNSRHREDPISGVFFSIGAILMLMPTVHFWYLSWIVPFLPLRPSKPWILLCAAISFYFVGNGIFYQTGVWTLPVWAWISIWLPFYLLMMGEGLVFFKRMRFKADWGPVRSVSVVIPAKNEAEKIRACIDAVKSDKSVHDVVVVDGGSIDETALFAKQAGAKVIPYTISPEKGGGRGGQIYAGISEAEGDSIAVVHADVTASCPVFSNIVQVLQKNPTLVGGAVGGVFNDPDWRFRIIELLNDFRAIFLGISFGDQIQFFRKNPVREKKLFPRIPIMEDVEFSILLNTIGRQTFLFENALISSRRWKNKGFRNAFSVIRRLSLFLLQRLRGLPDTASMYGRYYGKHLSGNREREPACKKSVNTLSIIIPVFNETDCINEMMSHLNALSFTGDAEIIVVDGNPAGNTIASMKENGSGRVRVKKILSAEGRGVQMNSGASIAEGDILLFLHVDTFIGQNALDAIHTVFDQSDCIGGAFDFRINSGRKIFRIIEKAASLRSRITRIPYGDQALFIQKEYFNQIGGFSPIPIMEDVELMRRIKKRGGKIKILPDTVQTSPRRWEKEGVLFCTLRNWMLIVLYFFGVSPEKLFRFYPK